MRPLYFPMTMMKWMMVYIHLRHHRHHHIQLGRKVFKAKHMLALTTKLYQRDGIEAFYHLFSCQKEITRIITKNSMSAEGLLHVKINHLQINRGQLLDHIARIVAGV